MSGYGNIKHETETPGTSEKASVVSTDFSQRPGRTNAENERPDSFEKISGIHSFYAGNPAKSVEMSGVGKDATVIAPEASVVRQTVSQVLARLKDVKHMENEFSFRLKPENLGEISVKMAVKDDVLTVEFLANNKETHSIIAANLDSIKEILKDSYFENQINNSVQDLPRDYLQENSNENQNAQNYGQHNQQRNDENPNAQFTDDFLSLLGKLNTENI